MSENLAIVLIGAGLWGVMSPRLGFMYLMVVILLSLMTGASVSVIEDSTQLELVEAEA